MKSGRNRIVEEIQKLASALIATSPAGHRLCLIGGFRYRLLNQSCRTSLDIDYHWDGDRERKQAQIADLLRAKLLPEVKRRFGYDGDVPPATGPDAHSPAVKIVAVAFYRTVETSDRIELPVEITSIPCLDPPVVRTAAGTVYLTASDADLIESKVMALFNRVFLEARDLVDLFLFQDSFVVDSVSRLKTKLAGWKIGPASVADGYARLLANRAVHVRAIDEIIDDQIDAAVAANLKAAGGGAMIFDAVMALLRGRLKIGEETGL